MSGIENTSKRPRLDWLFGGNPDAIVGQEAEGQRQLLSSDRLPTKTRGDFEALGFTFGDPDPSDPLFRPATLPDGWTREGSAHAMWSYLLDERGIKRVAIFYKAAFYDRDAFMNILNVGAECASEAIYGDGPVTGPWDTLSLEERAEAVTRAEQYLDDAREYPHIYGERTSRAEALLDQLTGRGGAA